MWNLDQSLGYLMNRNARGLKRALDAKLSEYNITTSQFVVLVRLWEEEGIALTTLGERLHLDNPTLTGIIDRMERDGLLERRRARTDRRVVTVHLTSTGQNLQRQIGHYAHQTDNEAFSGFSAKEQRDLLHLLQRIWVNVNGNENSKGTVPDTRQNHSGRTSDS